VNIVCIHKSAVVCSFEITGNIWLLLALQTLGLLGLPRNCQNTWIACSHCRLTNSVMGTRGPFLHTGPLQPCYATAADGSLWLWFTSIFKRFWFLINIKIVNRSDFGMPVGCYLLPCVKMLRNLCDRLGQA